MSKDHAMPKSSSYGITPEYDRKNYDSQTARRSFHESQFEDHKTITDASGTILHRSHDAATKKYGKKMASLHQAEADHKDPIKNIHSRVQKSPLKRELLTDEDIKEIANRTHNFQELSKRENATKQDKSELNRGIETRDIKRTVDGLATQTETDLLLTGRAARNAAKIVAASVPNTITDAVYVGKDAALVTLTISGINSLVAVAQGKMDLETAVSDVASASAQTFISAAGMEMAQQAVAVVAKHSQSELLASFTPSQIPGAEIAMAVMVAKSIGRYLDGDISAEDCAIEMLLNGVGTISYQIGMMAGGPVGAIVASIVATQIANTIEEYRQEKKIREQRDSEIQCVLSWARSEAQRQRNIIKDYLQSDLDRWDKEISDGFAQINRATQAEDSYGVAEGLNKLLSLIGLEVRFQTPDEFKNAFFGDSLTPFVM